jgi:hypothetical protein
MKFKAVPLLIAGALLAVLGFTACGDYRLENRPNVVFSGRGGDKSHINPYPMSSRAAAVWTADACWRRCTAQCGGRFNACAKGSGAEACRSGLDRCDRTCVFECRNAGGPLLYSFE